MKITCQACQSKYTIADDKIQGKVAKIRCRKCGATVLVDASAGGPSSSNETAGQAGQGMGAETWSVAIGEGDPRSMQLSEVVDAYNTGVITGETYVWKEGMGDWVMLAQCEEIVAVLRGAAPIAEPPTQLKPATSHTSERPHTAEMNASAGVSTNLQGGAERSRAADPFAGAPDEEEGVATSVPSNMVARAATAAGARSTAATGGGAVVSTTSTSGSATGSRDEQSLLFSLAALTSGSSAAAAGTAAGTVSSSPKKNDEDSGLIDLNALAKAQASQKASAPAADAGLFPAPFMFPAALGNVEVPAAEAIDIPPAKKKSKAPLFVGLGAAAVGVIALVAVVGSSQKPPETIAPAASAIEAISTPETLATHAPEPAPTPTQSVAPPPAEKRPAPAYRGPQRQQKQHGNDSPGAAVQAPAQPPPAAAPPRNKCGCPAGDLQCQIRCSATGR